MNYLLRSKPKSGYNWKVIFVFCLFGFLSLFGSIFPGFTRNFVLTLARPVWAGSQFVTKPFSNLKNYFSTKTKLIKENKILKEEVLTFKLKNIDYELLAKENENLKNQLGRNAGKNRVISRVLSRPPRSPYDTLVIDVGSVHGVAVDDKVYAGESIMIGTVKEVMEGSAIVALFSSGDYKQEAIQHRTGASFTLVGKGAANFGMEVPKDTDVLWGDVFVYPGLSASALATVYYIDDISKGSFKTIHLRIPGNIFQAQWVFVESQN